MCCFARKIKLCIKDLFIYTLDLYASMRSICTFWLKGNYYLQ